jgi:hypothetical protein
MCKNIAEQRRSQMIMWHVRIACWVPEATNTLAVYVTFIASPTTTMVSRTRLNIKLHLQCVSCYLYLCLILRSDFSVKSEF